MRVRLLVRLQVLYGVCRTFCGYMYTEAVCLGAYCALADAQTIGSSFIAKSNMPVITVVQEEKGC